jgi:hypothetical protein
MGWDSNLLLGTLIKFNANMPDVKSNGTVLGPVEIKRKI